VDETAAVGLPAAACIEVEFGIGIGIDFGGGDGICGRRCCCCAFNVMLAIASLLECSIV